MNFATKVLAVILCGLLFHMSTGFAMSSSQELQFYRLLDKKAFERFVDNAVDDEMKYTDKTRDEVKEQIEIEIVDFIQEEYTDLETPENYGEVTVERPYDTLEISTQNLFKQLQEVAQGQGTEIIVSVGRNESSILGALGYSFEIKCVDDCDYNVIGWAGEKLGLTWGGRLSMPIDYLYEVNEYFYSPRNRWIIDYAKKNRISDYNVLMESIDSIDYSIDWKISNYYTPVPGQKSYLNTTYQAEFDMNCSGNCFVSASGKTLSDSDTHKAFACPPEFPMGTRLQIEIPSVRYYKNGITLVGTCVDRGGAIKNHKIDVYTGVGKQGQDYPYTKFVGTDKAKVSILNLQE